MEIHGIPGQGLAEDPQRAHEGGEDPRQGGGPLHQDVHAGVVHVLADGGAGSLGEREKQGWVKRIRQALGWVDLREF